MSTERQVNAADSAMMAIDCHANRSGNVLVSMDSDVVTTDGRAVSMDCYANRADTTLVSVDSDVVPPDCDVNRMDNASVSTERDVMSTDCDANRTDDDLVAMESPPDGLGGRPDATESAPMLADRPALRWEMRQCHRKTQCTKSDNAPMSMDARADAVETRGAAISHQPSATSP